MKQLIASLTALFPALGMIGSLPAASGEDDEALVTRVLTDYYRAFSALDVQAILPIAMSHRCWLAPKELPQCLPTPHWWL